MTTSQNPIDTYIAEFEGITRERLTELRTLIQQLLPDAVERISYAIPCYRLGKHSVVFFAGYKKHIGMYPMPEGDTAFKELLAGYHSGASTARFPHNKPLPTDLIRQIVHFRLGELPAEGRN